MEPGKKINQFQEDNDPKQVAKRTRNLFYLFIYFTEEGKVA